MNVLERGWQVQACHLLTATLCDQKRVTTIFNMNPGTSPAPQQHATANCALNTHVHATWRSNASHVVRRAPREQQAQERAQSAYTSSAECSPMACAGPRRRRNPGQAMISVSRAAATYTSSASWGPPTVCPMIPFQCACTRSTYAPRPTAYEACRFSVMLNNPYAALSLRTLLALSSLRMRLFCAPGHMHAKL